MSCKIKSYSFYAQDSCHNARVYLRYNDMMNTAIIIKKPYPYQNKVALIDHKKRRFNGIVMSKKILIEGSIIQYTLERKGTVDILHNVEYLAIPLQWGKQDLLFLHHILEICYFFIPPESTIDGVFEFLFFLLHSEQLSWTLTLQKLFLCKLFLLLGMYPQTVFFKTNIMKKLLYISIKDVIQLEVDNHEQPLMDQWLQQCILNHQKEFSFKTMAFLERTGT